MHLMTCQTLIGYLMHSKECAINPLILFRCMLQKKTKLLGKIGKMTYNIYIYIDPHILKEAKTRLAQSAGAAKYTDCTSAEG